MSRIDDADNIYGDGPGKTLVLGIRNFELRVFEYYDLEDKTGVYDDAEFGAGRLGITSFGYRLDLAGAGPLHLTALLGGAWVRRPSLRLDPDDISSDYVLQAQHGLAGLVGGGVNLFGVLTIDVRAYPTMWSDLAGDSRVMVDAAGMQTVETIVESPGGMPITVNVGLGFAY